MEEFVEEASVEEAVERSVAPASPQKKLLPARLSRFAPFDPEGERGTALRLKKMSPAALRQRRQRIDNRLYELGLAIGEPALEIPSVRGTGMVDLDRILRKIDRLDDAGEQARLEREATRPEAGFVNGLLLDLDWIGEVFAARGIRTRHNLLVSELGLALCACDHEVLKEYAPHIKRLMDGLVASARRIDELFVEARLVDAEFARRVREGAEREEPKDIDRLISRAFDSVDGVSSRVGDTLADLGKSAAKTSGQTAWALAKGMARGAWYLGSRPFRSDPAHAGDEAPGEEGSLPPLLLDRGPSAGQVPQLIRDLAQLRQEGLLTEDEFTRKKAELLARL